MARWCKEIFNKIIEYAEKGYTNKEIAFAVGISEKTFYKWLKDKSELLPALKKAKLEIDRKVEQALLRRALGYEFDEIMNEDGSSSNGSFDKIRTIRKHILPDVTAQIFWLKNRQPKRWRDTKNIDVKNNQENTDKNLLKDLLTNESEEN